MGALDRGEGLDPVTMVYLESHALTLFKLFQQQQPQRVAAPALAPADVFVGYKVRFVSLLFRFIMTTVE
jgi:hypothetical protein